MEYWQVILPILMFHLKSAAAWTEKIAIYTGLTLIQAMQQIVDTKALMSHKNAAKLLGYVLDNGDPAHPSLLEFYQLPKAAAL